ncbi:MAG: hypothetical protein ACFB00_01600 [Parvularculaceae bacterium]
MAEQLKLSTPRRLRRRPARVLDVAFFLPFIFLPAGAASLNWLRGEWRAVVAVGAGLVVALGAAVFLPAMFGAGGDWAWARDLSTAIRGGIGDAPKEALKNFWPAPAIAAGLFTLLQHIVDKRGWHKSWRGANFDRFSLNLSRPHGALDFPILVFGVGGAGKTTLAGIMETEFLRRRIIKPRGLSEFDSEESLVVRNDGGLGGSVRNYEITWRPELYKVGRLAEAYDMPGQIIGDWESALSASAASRRVAIFNVLTNGYSASLRKFNAVERPAGEISDDDLRRLVREEKLLLQPREDGVNAIDERYLEQYREHIFEREAASFDCVADFIVRHWGRASNRPKLVVMHVVNMAAFWWGVDGGSPDGGSLDGGPVGSRLRPGDWNETQAVYERLFKASYDKLKGELGDDVFVHFAPVSLLFGDLDHEFIPARAAAGPNAKKATMKLFRIDADADETDPEATKVRRAHYQRELAIRSVEALRRLRFEMFRPYRGPWGGALPEGADMKAMHGAPS